MRMIQKLKLFEQTVVFLRWATDAQFGKILYVGEDFILAALDISLLAKEMQAKELLSCVLDFC